MSRTTSSIMRIITELDKISGLDGIVADKIEELETQVKIMVSDILINYSEADIFDHYGDGINALVSNIRYSASVRASDIKKAIQNVQRDGLKVAINEKGNLYVENTVRTARTNDYTDSYGYAEIEIIHDED